MNYNSIQRNHPNKGLKGCPQLIQASFKFSTSFLLSLWKSSSQPQQITCRAIWRKRSSPRSMGLLLSCVGDLFPLTIPRWRWGIRILQGNSSPPLDNSPSPGDFTETLC